MWTIQDIREAVATKLEEREFSNREFLRQVRAGEQDDGPYMLGALASAELIERKVAA